MITLNLLAESHGAACVDAAPEGPWIDETGQSVRTLATACPVCRMAVTPSNPHDDCEGLLAIPAEYLEFVTARWLVFERVPDGVRFTFRDLYHHRTIVTGRTELQAVAHAMRYVEGQRRAIERAGRAS